MAARLHSFQGFPAQNLFDSKACDLVTFDVIISRKQPHSIAKQYVGTCISSWWLETRTHSVQGLVYALDIGLAKYTVRPFAGNPKTFVMSHDRQ